MDTLYFLLLATVLILLEYWIFSIIVSLARYRFKVVAPAVSGHPTFERLSRVQLNMMEQMILFLPVMWIFAGMVSDSWAFYLGLVWILGRAIYAFGYYKLNFIRTIGFGISAIATLVCLFGSLVALIGYLMHV